MNKLTCKIVVIVIVISMALTACGNKDYSLASGDQGNASTMYQRAVCASNVGSNVQAGINCLVH